MYFLINPACSVVFKQSSFSKFEFVAHFLPGGKVSCWILCWGVLLILFISEIYVLWEWVIKEQGGFVYWKGNVYLKHGIIPYMCNVSLPEVVHYCDKVQVVFSCLCFNCSFHFWCWLFSRGRESCSFQVSSLYVFRYLELRHFTKEKCRAKGNKICGIV